VKQGGSRPQAGPAAEPANRGWRVRFAWPALHDDLAAKLRRPAAGKVPSIFPDRKSSQARAAAPLAETFIRTGRKNAMSLRINDEAPNFAADTTQGRIDFHEWIGGSWAILFSHPKDFTPVCTTELGYMAGLLPEFEKRNTKIIGLSADPVEEHRQWLPDIEKSQGHKVTYPMIGDPDLKISKLYDMLPAGAGETAQGRTPADNATVRSVFIIDPDKKIRAVLTYPMSAGRNFQEVLRLLDAIQLASKHPVATPVNWKPGEDVIIVPSLPEAEAQKQFPEGWNAPLPYMRLVPQPK
jgi:thioredoxin-dependent peroxiredoxin